MYYPAGYAAALWAPAGMGEWSALRWGMQVSLMYNGGDIANATYAGNLLYALESTLEASYQVPFNGLTDRPWAIDDATVNITLPDLLYKSSDYVLTDGYQGGGSPYWINNKVRLREARALVHAGASDARSGPSGVVLSSLDYRGVLAGNCSKLYNVGAFDLRAKPLRFQDDYLHDFALQCKIVPSGWVAKAFPTASRAAVSKPLTIQCPTYPWMYGSSFPGYPKTKPQYPRCGLSTTPDISFSGSSGTDTTCCFDKVHECFDRNGDPTDCIDLPTNNPDQYSKPTCNRYDYNNEWQKIYSTFCQDMQECVGGGRLEWPFLVGASLDTGTTDPSPCFKVPAPNDVVSRLPVLDIRTIPQTLSPFTQFPYCIRDG